MNKYRQTHSCHGSEQSTVQQETTTIKTEPRSQMKPSTVTLKLQHNTDEEPVEPPYNAMTTTTWSATATRNGFAQPILQSGMMGEIGLNW